MQLDLKEAIKAIKTPSPVYDSIKIIVVPNEWMKGNTLLPMPDSLLTPQTKLFYCNERTARAFRHELAQLPAESVKPNSPITPMLGVYGGLRLFFSEI